MQKSIWMIQPPFKPVILDTLQPTFPDPRLCDDEGLVAVGGNLSVPTLLKAYQKGLFPWYEADQPILWWSPNPRMILKPGDFILHRSLKKSLKNQLRFTFDTAFAEVISACAHVQDRAEHTWITYEMTKAYIALHQAGYAHSLEIWEGEHLIGGLYGLSLGGAFFGESMFHKKTDASKMAFFHLQETLFNSGFDFIDCQIPNQHLKSLGCTSIPRTHFLDLLHETLQKPTQRGSWQSDFLSR